MKNFSQQEVMERYDTLPDPVKDAIFAEATAEKMNEIGKKHNLLIDKIGILAKETGYVMLGLEHPNDFVGNLASMLGVSTSEAREIVQDINESIFKPIREHLMQIHEKPAAPSYRSQTFTPRPPSFAMNPSSSQDATPQTQTQPASVPTMIFPQKMGTGSSDTNKTIPPAPKFEPPQTQKGDDPYREPVQ